MLEYCTSCIKYACTTRTHLKEGPSKCVTACNSHNVCAMMPLPVCYNRGACECVVTTVHCKVVTLLGSFFFQPL